MSTAQIEVMSLLALYVHGLITSLVSVTFKNILKLPNAAPVSSNFVINHIAHFLEGKDKVRPRTGHEVSEG
jgi:hypothetical protein